nr:NAD(P)-dependent oxidoreductase [Methylobacterium sp.]
MNRTLRTKSSDCRNGVPARSFSRQQGRIGMDIQTVGVVGLGNMGLGMATTLVRKGFRVVGTDVNAARGAAAEAAGVRFVPAPAEVLCGADALVVSLPLARDVEAVVTAEGGLLARRDRKVVVIDTSTSDPQTTRRLAARLAEAGHALLDAPVSGGPSGAAEGTLTMMVGGDEADYALARPVLQAMSARALHVGPSGAGNIVKLVNNLLVAAHLVTTGEAMRLSEAAGLSAEDAAAIVNTATGRSAVSEVMLPRWVLPGTFDSGFSAGLMRKDVGLALDLAAETGTALPLSAHVGRIWEEARARISDTADFTRMADYRITEGDA